MTDIINFIQTITLGQLAIAVLAITALLEAATKTLKPWTQLMNWLGKGVNREVLKKLDEQRDESKALKDEVTSLAERIDKKDAEDARNHILRFGDEIKNGVRHSEEYFNQILADITNYEHYCGTHPSFKNEKTVMTERIIREVYHKCVKENDFL